MLYTLELKTTGGTSFTFYRPDFGEKHSYMIKKHQLKGLRASRACNGVVSGFILNFRRTVHTYFIDILDFDRMTGMMAKKSFNEQDIAEFQPVRINQQLIRTRYSYDITGFCTHMHNMMTRRFQNGKEYNPYCT